MYPDASFDKRNDILLTTSKSNSKKTYACTKCPKIFKNPQSFISHTLNDCGKIYKCEHCHKYYKYYASYHRHLESNCVRLS